MLRACSARSESMVVLTSATRARGELQAREEQGLRQGRLRQGQELGQGLAAARLPSYCLAICCHHK
eukprot:11997612-Alexandrium_andersonii.AAC.1